MIGIALRGLRSRRLLTAGSLLLAVIAFASAMLGPIYQRTATQSYRVATLQGAPATITAVTLDYTPEAGGGAPQTVAASVRAGLDQTAAALPTGFETPRPMLVSVAGVTGALAALARVPQMTASPQLVAADGACAHVRLTAGRCPARAAEVILLTQDASYLHLRVGQEFAPYGGRVLRLVGTYLPEASAAAYWLDPGRLASVPYMPPTGNAAARPYQPAPFITVAATFRPQRPGWRWRVRIDAPLHVDARLSSATLGRAVAEVHALAVATSAAPGGRPGRIALEIGNALPALTAQIDQRRTVAAAAVAPAVVALVMVALVLLLRLLSAAVELRRGELALAGLRGWSPGRLWVLGLLEPLLVIVVALPLGAAVGYAAALGLTRWWLLPGIAVPVPLAGVGALAAVLVLAAGVAAAALHGTLAEPVASRLVAERRPGRLGRTGLVLLLTLVAVTLAVLVLAALRRHGSSPDLVDLVLPVLLAVVAGLAGGAVLRRLAGLLVGRTARRRGLVGFVATRTLARRREGVLVVLPLTAAVAIGIFSTAIYDDAARWRASAAATQVGADVSYPMQIPLDAAVRLTQRIDPQGRYLMAAEEEHPTIGPARYVVDTSRLARVSVWPSQWTPGLSVDQIQRAFASDRPAVILTGRRLSVRLDNRTRGGDGTLNLEVAYVDAAGGPHTVILGPYAADATSTLQRRLEGCAQGCTLTALSLGPLVPLPTGTTGVATIETMDVDATPVAGALDQGWRTLVPGAAPTLRDGAIVVRLSANPDAIAAITPTDVPAVTPVLVGRTSTGDPAGGLGAPTPVHVVGSTESMPFVGPTGVMVDAAAYSRSQPLAGDLTSVHILARGDTPAAMVDQLTAAGAGAPERLSAVRSRLDQDAFALVLRLYLVAAGVVLLLALAGLSTNLVVQLPARRREAAALRVVGMRRRAVWLATAAELTATLAAAAAAGLVAGFVAQYVVARTVTLGYVDAPQTPRSVPDFGLVDAVLLAGAVAVVLVVLAAALGGLVIRGARGATLRESAR